MRYFFIPPDEFATLEQYTGHEMLGKRVQRTLMTIIKLKISKAQYDGTGDMKTIKSYSIDAKGNVHDFLKGLDAFLEAKETLLSVVQQVNESSLGDRGNEGANFLQQLRNAVPQPQAREPL